MYDRDGRYIASIAYIREDAGVDRKKSTAAARRVRRACNTNRALLAALEDVNECLADFYKIDGHAAGLHFGAALKERMDTAVATTRGV